MSTKARVYRPILLATILFVVFFAIVGVRTIPASAADMYEDYRFSKNPSAERAYEIASENFDARYPEAYDVERARKYFRLALELNPALPNLHHQLARIEFLIGNFEQALSHINTEIRGAETPLPSAFYVKGLIEGYMGSYANAALNYERYLAADPYNWAALNDYAWVLLKGERFQEALVATDIGLQHFPDNAWLLNSKATALYELGQYDNAHTAALRASETVGTITEQNWLTAYPGNDPRVAAAGLFTLRTSIEKNLRLIQEATEVR